MLINKSKYQHTSIAKKKKNPMHKNIANFKMPMKENFK